MRARFPATTLILLLITACSSSSPEDPPPDASTTSSPSSSPEADPTRTLTWADKERTYRLHVPASLDASPPLVVAMHYYPGDSAGMANLTELNAVADAEGFIVAYPDGLDGGVNALVCCGNEDDVGFIGEMVSEVQAEFGADPARTYATGISNGGDMSYRVAVELPGVFAAIAPVSGGYIGPMTEKKSFVPDSPVSVLTFYGEQDRYADDFATGLSTWRKRLDCTVTSDEPPGGAVAGVKYEATRCADGSEVVSYAIEDMGHAWPGAATGQLPAPDAPVSATDLMWEFFSRHAA